MSLQDLSQLSAKPNTRPPRLRRVGILGTGCFAPEKILSNADFERLVNTSDQWIRERTGMSERHIASSDQATSDLAIPAALAALEQAKLSPVDVELILVATATPDTPFPSTACRVQQAIGARNAAGFDVSAACAGFINALLTADSMLAAGRFRNALVIGAEKLSSITDYEDRNTCVLFGDGAGAVVLGVDSPQGELLDHLVRIDGSGLDLIEQPAGGSLRPPDHGTVDRREHTIRIKGRKVFRFAVSVICDSVREILQRNGYGIDDLDLLIPHQANLRIIEAASGRLGIDPARVAVNIERYGNTSAASVPIALAELVQAGRIEPGHLVAFVAFGSGLTWGATLLRW